ncbi:MAG: hypothetical protein NTV46_12910 [Verrucomicrobia bacterium]|nr:hypothetical protein [Verrucomicrobiota bacterium]
MSGPRWLKSPLAGTACVLAGLALLAIPLRKLTSAEPPRVGPSARPAVPSTEIPAVLRLRLLTPAQRVVVTSADGTVLLDLRDPMAGVSEHDAVIPFATGRLELDLQADFPIESAATAVFLTVMPDGYEDQTRHVIGNGRMAAPLRYEWHTPHE